MRFRRSPKPIHVAPGTSFQDLLRMSNVVFGDHFNSSRYLSHWTNVGDRVRGPFVPLHMANAYSPADVDAIVAGASADLGLVSPRRLRLATLYELVAYAVEAGDKTVVALGSVYTVDGRRHVGMLSRTSFNSNSIALVVESIGTRIGHNCVTLCVVVDG